MSASRQIDWDLEIITDNEIKVPESLEYLAQTSVTTRTPVCTDALGLSYPDVNPRARLGVEITGFLVKTTFEYALPDSGYVLELAVYRKWLERGEEPEITAGFSMYHRHWDDNMQKLPRTSKRDWDDPLKEFFGRCSAKNEVPGDEGVKIFLAEVERIQGLMADAVFEAKGYRKDTEATDIDTEVEGPARPSLNSFSSAEQQSTPDGANGVEVDYDGLYSAD